ncbi:MAG: hypothetical protein HY645_09280 [Acidobacteria bacterium]|nr:hypothetical protein [Acidobacteriota bacterium]
MRKKHETDETLPLRLKLQLLESELSRLDSDMKRLMERRSILVTQIHDYEKLVTDLDRRSVLRRVK